MKNNKIVTRIIAIKPQILAVISGLGASIGIGLLAVIGEVNSDVVLLMAPFGATAVIVFGLPTSPLAQPKNVILGHFLTALIGVIFVQFGEVNSLTLALATGLGVSVMLLSKTTHPPAGANPILIMLSGQSWGFLITPVLSGAIVLVLISQLLKHLHQKVQALEVAN